MIHSNLWSWLVNCRIVLWLGSCLLAVPKWVLHWLHIQMTPCVEGWWWHPEKLSNTRIRRTHIHRLSTWKVSSPFKSAGTNILHVSVAMLLCLLLITGIKYRSWIISSPSADFLIVLGCLEWIGLAWFYQIFATILLVACEFLQLPNPVTCVATDCC